MSNIRIVFPLVGFIILLLFRGQSFFLQRPAILCGVLFIDTLYEFKLCLPSYLLFRPTVLLTLIKNFLVRFSSLVFLEVNYYMALNKSS